MCMDGFNGVGGSGISRCDRYLNTFYNPNKLNCKNQERKKCLNNKSKHLSLFRCEPGYFGFPNCQNCSCAEPGSSSNVCDELSGKVKNNETHFKSYPYFRNTNSKSKVISETIILAF